MRKVLISVAAVLLSLVLVVLAASYFTVRRSFSQVDGTVSIRGLQSEVRVYRDSWGVPHIYAGSEHDLFFTQGYVQAQDRLWQMELFRRMGSGTLSEVFGPATLDNDRFSRTIGLRRYAVESFAALDPGMREVLGAYSAGVNEFLRVNGDNLPVEFRLMGFTPSDWDPVDTLTVANLISWNLGKNWEVELTRGRLAQKLGSEKAGQLMAPYPGAGPLVLPPEFAAYSSGTTVASGLHFHSDSAGSNNWVVDGSKTINGKPLLANDPHLSVMMPSIWYENGLHGAGFDVVGASLPGCPLVIIGRNSNISWGITNLPADTQDLFIEKINPAGNLQYEYGGKWENIRVLDETIGVKGSRSAEVLKVRLTQHGPLMDEIISGLQQPLSLQWVGYSRSNLLKSAYLLDRARNWEEFHSALRYWDAPGQNIVYADGDGNIGYQSTGLIPLRKNGQGMLPSPGWSGEYDWSGYIPYEEMPRVLNPSTHFIVTANNKVISDNYTYFMAYDWSPAYRAMRITDLLQAKERLSVQDFRDIQADIYDIPASVFVPYLYNMQPQDSREIQALEMLREWDFNDRADSTAPTIFHVFYVKLLHNTLEKKLGTPLFNDYLRAMGGSGDVHTVFMAGIMDDNNNQWFDDESTVQKETRDDIVRLSFTQAISELTGRFGPYPGWWMWGNLHGTSFKHVLGRIPGLDLIFSLGPVSTPGSRYTVNVAAFDYSNPYSVVAIPSYRQIIDWGDPDKSLAMHSTGQSGQPFSAHYSDMVKSWLGVEYHTMLFNAADIETASRSVLLLMPVE